MANFLNLIFENGRRLFKGEDFNRIVAAINALAAGSGGSGFISTEVDVSNGTIGTATKVGTFIGFNSGSFNSKVAHIPASTGSLGMIVISDVIGTAGTYNITVNQPVVGLNVVYTDNGALRLLDTKTYGWLSI
jgi:hypothetical protein